jgi:putative FmdB family regulatory protein
VPTYSYRCADCDHAFDIHQAFTDDNLTICPNCGGTLRKIFSPVGVSFSGSGFYRNDSRAESGKGSGSKDATSTSDGSKSESKSDSGATSDSSSKPDSAASTPKKDSTPAPKKEKSS